MIVGSGLIAKALINGGADGLGGTCFYAAGVSNSGCNDEREYVRERMRFDAAIAECSANDRVVYFSTCSIDDPALRDSDYVKHKTLMESRVRERANYLILRLPQVAGRSPNPHTLLNYLHARIARSERFRIWGGAMRNIIDVDDIVRITMDLIVAEGANAETIDIASPRSSTIIDVVHAMEHALGARAVFDISDKGSGMPIDTGRISASIKRCAVKFGSTYLDDVIAKYYGAHSDEMPVFPLRHNPSTVFHEPRDSAYPTYGRMV